MNGYNPQQPSNETRRTHSTLKTISLTVLFLLLIGATASGAYIYNDNTKLKTTLSKEQKKNQNQTIELNRLKSSKEVQPVPGDKMSETLPDGQTISYPLNEKTAQIIWWTDSSDNIVLSHKKTLSYASSIPEDTRKTVCGVSTVVLNQTHIAMGFFDTKNKALKHNKYANCLQSLAATTINKDTTSQQAANKVLDEVNSDLLEFVRTAAVQ